MVRVYINSKQECPRDAVVRRGKNGALYYLPDERGNAAEVGGVTETFEDLFSNLYKRRVYVDNPASVPAGFEPMRGSQGSWYYETESEETGVNVLEQLVEMIVEQIIPELAEDDYYQDDIAPRVYDRVQDRVQLSDGSVDEKSVRTAVESILKVKDGRFVAVKDSVMNKQKNQLDRVYVADESQVPEAYTLQRDENGDSYYVRDDGQFIDSDRETTAYKDYELREGLSWTEEVMVTEIDEETGMVEMTDTLTGSEWQEEVEDVEAKLEVLESKDHEWLYDMVAGEYASLEDEDVHEVLHEAAGIDKGVRLDWQERLDKDEDPCWDGYTMVGLKDNGNPRCVPDDDVENYDADKSQKSRVYVDNESEVPEQYDAQTSDSGAVYYETDSGSGDRELVDGDDISDEQLNEMEDNIEDLVSEVEGKVREMGEDFAMAIIEENPDQSVEEVNDRVADEMVGEVMERVQQEFGVELDGDLYDMASETIYEEMEDVIGDAQATAEEFYMETEAPPTEPEEF